VNVILWAPNLQGMRSNVERWGLIYTPRLVGHTNYPLLKIERRQCLLEQPGLCKMQLKSLDDLFSAPTTEQTLPDFEKALRKRVDLYYKLKSKQVLTDQDVALSTEEDVRLDRLGFNAVLVGFNNRSPGVLACRRSLELTLFRDTVLADFIRYESEIAKHRLRTCLSEQIKTLFLAQYPELDVVELDKEKESRYFPQCDEWSVGEPFTWVYAQAKTLRHWISCPFEVAADLIACRLVWIYKGTVILHIGHVYHLLQYRVVQQLMREITKPFTESLGDELNDSRLIPLLRHQLGRIWQTTEQGAPEPGFVRDSVPLSALKERAPPCIVRMILSLTHPSPSLPPLNHHNEFLFLSLSLRFGVKPSDLIERMQARIVQMYPRSEWKNKQADVKYQIEYLDKKRKPYSWGCKQMQTGNKPWCPYTMQSQPQHRCASKLPNADRPAFITSPWAFIVERQKSKRHTTISYTP
jgi:hypothetical protein